MNQETAAEILRVVNQVSEAFQTTMTDEERAALAAKRAAEPEVAHYAAANAEEAMDEFMADAIGTLADEMQAVIDGRLEAVYRQALEAYYVAEELARDPAHANLIPHVEAMRRAHLESYGKPIPAKSQPGNG